MLKHNDSIPASKLKHRVYDMFTVIQNGLGVVTKSIAGAFARVSLAWMAETLRHGRVELLTEAENRFGGCLSCPGTVTYTIPSVVVRTANESSNVPASKILKLASSTFPPSLISMTEATFPHL